MEVLRLFYISLFLLVLTPHLLDSDDGPGPVRIVLVLSPAQRDFVIRRRRMETIALEAQLAFQIRRRAMEDVGMRALRRSAADIAARHRALLAADAADEALELHFALPSTQFVLVSLISFSWSWSGRLAAKGAIFLCKRGGVP
jgi:hypothetical protein